MRRIVYLGGLVPPDGTALAPPGRRGSRSRSRCSTPCPESIALRASIVIGARSRSFRFLVRLVERLPVLALPAWRDEPHRADRRPRRARLPRRRAATAPRSSPAARGTSPGPDVMTYGELIERIADAMLVGRPPLGLDCHADAAGAVVVAAAVAGEDPALIGPLMEGPRARPAPARRRRAGASAFGCTRFDAAVERALREWERDEELRRAMSAVTATIDIDAPPEEVWNADHGPARLREWVTIHRKLGEPTTGRRARATRSSRRWPARRELQGALDAHRGRARPSVGDLGGPGPGRLLRAHRPTALDRNGDGGTHFEYENEFKAPGGFLGAARLARAGRRRAASARPTSRCRQLKTLLES